MNPSGEDNVKIVQLGLADRSDVKEFKSNVHSGSDVFGSGQNVLEFQRIAFIGIRIGNVSNLVIKGIVFQQNVFKCILLTMILT